MKRRIVKALPKPTPKLKPASHQDLIGQTIVVGDWVAYSSVNTTALRLGRIKKINEKTVIASSNHLVITHQIILSYTNNNII